MPSHPERVRRNYEDDAHEHRWHVTMGTVKCLACGTKATVADANRIVASYATMREVYNRCSAGVGIPQAVIAGGDLVNLALGTNEYDPASAYVVTEDGIEPLEQRERFRNGDWAALDETMK